MEVIVRNLPDQITEKQVNKYFRDVLDKLGIKTYQCQKLRSRGCATITILDLGRARQFMKIHGQTEPGAKGFNSVQQKLYHMHRPINCTQSNKLPDQFLLSSLKKEESDRYAAQSRKPNIVSSKGMIPQNDEDLGRAFDVRGLRCGQWAYIHSDLAYVTYSHEPRFGRIVFGDRNILMKFSPNLQDMPWHQVEIPYNSIQSFTVGPKSKPTMTFSLSEAPKFFEVITTEMADVNGNNLTEMLQGMSLRRPSHNYTRKRICALSQLHETVVASCLCYRVTLVQPDDLKGVQALKKFPAIPGSISWTTSTSTREPFAGQIKMLNSALADGGKYGKIPFEVKFQMQKLAQNGYLPPSRVVDLLAVVARQLKTGADYRAIAGAVRSLLGQIPFPGPDTESSDLSLKTLSTLLIQNIESIMRGETYAIEVAEQHEHIVAIHKATVTPAGVYLYGPEPELNNRVLRKYSAVPNHFLSVSFLDENGEPLRLDRQTSGQEIYHVRYKRVLEGIINITGRGYEVSRRQSLVLGELTAVVLGIFSLIAPVSDLLVYGTFYN